MGFLAGRASFERFRVGGRELHGFDQRHVDILERHAIGRGALAADGVEVGFTAGEHLLDLDFSLEKNVYPDSLHAAVRIDVNKPPADLLKAYTQLELGALAAQNPSGYPTRQQRQEARQAAQERCHEESKTGKFRRMKQYSFLWDVRTGVVYFGSSSQTAMERFVSLFKEAFDRPLSRLTSGVLALDGASKRNQTRALEDLSPAVFAGPKRKISVAWVADQFGSRDFLGNEFLLWLWWVTLEQSDVLSLADDSTVTCWLNKTLTLECPMNETGRETLSSDAPTKLPEAKRAALGGKLPRKTGITLVRHDAQYDLTLQAESLSVGSANLPKGEAESGRPAQEERIEQLRHLSETIDLAFDAFCRRRLSSAWQEDLPRIRGWLESED